MKNHLIHASAISLLALASCAPELARSPYGENEMMWQKYIQDSYKGWQPPPAPPPLAQTPTIQVDQTVPASDILPPPAVEPHGIALPISESMPPPVDVVAKADLKTLPAGGKFSEYVVQKGDTLSSIAKKLYKNGGKWQVIYDANKNVISNPKALKPGVKLRIPAI